MNLLVWVTMGIAVWHFAVFVPDRFWGGIVGAFGAAAIGAVLFGLAVSGGNITDTSLTTALQAVPGALIGLAASWFYGARREAAHA
jgi:outer membrane lipoprotein SlyB